MIVACASLNKLDIVYSADNKTLLSKQALKAYKHIHIKESLKLPTFFTYEDLLVRFRSLSPSA